MRPKDGWFELEVSSCSEMGRLNFRTLSDLQQLSSELVIGAGAEKLELLASAL